MVEKPSNSYKFYRNLDCMFFPCHKTEHPEAFNCLFCYCPLFFLGEKCGGNFQKIKGMEGVVKDCTNCLIPHMPEQYERITKLLADNMEQDM